MSGGRDYYRGGGGYRGSGYGSGGYGRDNRELNTGDKYGGQYIDRSSERGPPPDNYNRGNNVNRASYNDQRGYVGQSIINNRDQSFGSSFNKYQASYESYKGQVKNTGDTQQNYKASFVNTSGRPLSG